MITTTCFIWPRRNSALNECRKTFSQTLKWSIFYADWCSELKHIMRSLLHLINLKKKNFMYVFALSVYQTRLLRVCPKKKRYWNKAKDLQSVISWNISYGSEDWILEIDSYATKGFFPIRSDSLNFLTGTGTANAVKDSH